MAARSGKEAIFLLSMPPQVLLVLALLPLVAVDGLQHEREHEHVAAAAVLPNAGVSTPLAGLEGFSVPAYVANFSKESELRQHVLGGLGLQLTTSHPNNRSDVVPVDADGVLVDLDLKHPFPMRSVHNKQQKEPQSLESSRNIEGDSVPTLDRAEESEEGSRSTFASGDEKVERGDRKHSLYGMRRATRLRSLANSHFVQFKRQLFKALSTDEESLEKAGGGHAHLGEWPATIVGILCIITYFYLQLTGLDTVGKIYKQKTTGNYSPAQFISQCLNGMVWCVYGWLAKKFIIVVPNFTAFLLGAVYSAIYLRYAKGNTSMHVWICLSLYVVVWLIMALIFVEHRLQTIGFFGSVTSVCMLAAPLASVGTVIKEKNTSSLPFKTSAASLINATLWLVYGLYVIVDPYVYVPSVLGVIASLVHVSLFLIYRASPGIATKTTTSDCDDGWVVSSAIALRSSNKK